MESQKPEGEHKEEKKPSTSVKDVGLSADRNARHRRFMEDAHIVEDGFDGHPDRGFFCVFDGHGGKSAALFAQGNMSRIMKAELATLPDAAAATPEQLQAVLTAVYAKTDEEMKPSVPAAGACAVTAYIQKNKEGKRWLYVCNAGDSKAVLKRGPKAELLTVEHKPQNEAEANRIKALGAFIKDDGGTLRVNGMIGITRALGDHMMKDLLINTPHFHATELHPEDELLILACDGVWDVFSEQEAVDLIAKEADAQAMSKKLLVESIKKGSTDNISVLVLIL